MNVRKVSRMPDLIDREALKRHLGYINTGFGGWASILESAIQAFRVFVDGEKAVDAVPAVHGHWILSYTGKITCSECEAPSAMSRSFTGLQYKSKYCPNCGAKMEDEYDGKSSD